MKIIAQFISGSRAYGLDTNDSDIDNRYLFLNTEISKIIGLNRHDHQNILNSSEDSQGFELRHALNLLKKGNTQLLELIHNDKWIVCEPEFTYIQKNKENLISSEQLFKCLLGYVNGEKHIILGANTGKLGAKRKEQLEKFGYSYRNVVHALRLIRTGILFFRDNIYPVNIVESDKEYGEFIKDVKVNPQNHKVENLINLIEKFESDLKRYFDLRSINYTFNDELANNICYDLYMMILRNKV